MFHGCEPIAVGEIATKTDWEKAQTAALAEDLEKRRAKVAKAIDKATITPISVGYTCERVARIVVDELKNLGWTAQTVGDVRDGNFIKIS